jgi:hypothetical protein
LAIDKKALNKFEWNELIDSMHLQVYYLQLNFFNYPADNYIAKNIMNFKDLIIAEKSFLLNEQQRKKLYNLITGSSNFTLASDCGTFSLNAGFIIANNNKVRATISIGCGYNQWNFNPYNPSSQNSSFNEKGFEQMANLLDNINLANSQ